MYTGEYYLADCHGYEDFAESNGLAVGPRFAKALSLAGELSGKRVLDIGCGRGELVVQSALRGAEAWGIDYAPAAVDIAERARAALAPELAARVHVAGMDVKALEFDDAAFDVVFLMDVVEHLYPGELALALDELRRVLRTGGRMVLHTSPNTTLARSVYPRYIRRVNAAALAISRRFGYREGVFNEFLLPVDEAFPQSEFERLMHVNEQTAPRLRRTLRAHGFRVRSTQYWEPPMKAGYARLGIERDWRLHALDFVRFLRPLSYHPPLNRWFCNHIWMTAERS